MEIPLHGVGEIPLLGGEGRFPSKRREIPLQGGGEIPCKGGGDSSPRGGDSPPRGGGGIHVGIMPETAVLRTNKSVFKEW